MPAVAVGTAITHECLNIVLAASWGTGQGVESGRSCVLVLHQKDGHAGIRSQALLTHKSSSPRGRDTEREDWGCSVIESPQVPRAAHNYQEQL